MKNIILTALLLTSISAFSEANTTSITKRDLVVGGLTGAVGYAAGSGRLNRDVMISVGLAMGIIMTGQGICPNAGSTLCVCQQKAVYTLTQFGMIAIPTVVLALYGMVKLSG